MEPVTFKEFVQDESRRPCGPSKDIQVKRWSMHKGHRIHYLNSDFHTLSLYLAGGNKNTRADRPFEQGSTGSFCFMPQAQDSIWTISQTVSFAHLYFTDDFLKRYCAKTFQLDTRFVELKDQLFLDDPELRSAFLNCLLALGPQGSRSNLAIEQLSYDVVHLAVEKFSVVKLPKMAITGGLSAAHRRSTLNQITDRLGKKITLVELADAVHLSPYHFARMFKLSFGETPARFVDWMRIERAKALLNRKWSLSAISAELGYSHQSHMTQHFKHWVGVTPARYRAEYS